MARYLSLNEAGTTREIAQSGKINKMPADKKRVSVTAVQGGLDDLSAWIGGVNPNDSDELSTLPEAGLVQLRTDLGHQSLF